MKLDDYLDKGDFWSSDAYNAALRALQSLKDDCDKERTRDVNYFTDAISIIESAKNIVELENRKLKKELDGWIGVNDELPLRTVNEKVTSKMVFFTDGKKVYKGFYYPKRFKTCDWSDFDVEPEDYDYHHVELIDNDLWLKEGWWSEYEHYGEFYEVHVPNVTEWMYIPEKRIKIIS